MEMETGDFAVVHADGSMRFFFVFFILKVIKQPSIDRINFTTKSNMIEIQLHIAALPLFFSFQRFCLL